MFTLNCKGKLLAIEKPVVMGILNITADSFYKGYLNDGTAAILQQAERMIGEGAAIIDIGGQSTRPGSVAVSAEEELERVVPVIELLSQQFPELVLSIDTYYSKVAVAAVTAGASIVNDISGGNLDAAMIPAVGKSAVPYICMHMKGIPATMQDSPQYEDVVQEVLEFFVNKTAECKAAGINDLILDPGFGFGKTTRHNFQLLKNLSAFQIFEKPLLAGLSRKGTIYRTLGITAGEALNGTTILNTLALQNGAAILRVHDVKEAVEAVKLMEEYKDV
ncbi:dihydropteroate synthase [Ferruginibacter sp. HRS2-29]|uniref:dihydropteroate synthase n=1 Tax=Ferruginibacter sp. HRS2-29 TaxID=2487334 RepID=UPI0020CC6014|nr:dihydropteroate synthase [Ferruginibacter sp. HRS2-29]MCP9750071.1 dihydropteroate synthase [Ferruginibacter sp. HRS2-29]